MWTVATEQLMAAARAYHAGCKLQDVHAVDRTVHATIVCVSYVLLDGKRYAHVASRIVAIDPESGKTLRVLEPHVSD